MINFVGQLIERIKASVTEWGATPHTEIIVRVGDFGPEMRIEHVKLRAGMVPVVILQCAIPQ